MLNNVNNIFTKQIILGGHLNFYFDSLPEAKGGNPFLKKSVAIMIEIKEAFDLCNICKKSKFNEIHISTKSCYMQYLKKA